MDTWKGILWHFTTILVIGASAEQANSTEEALWAGMRALREQADLRPGSQVKHIIQNNGKPMEGLNESSET